MKVQPTYLFRVGGQELQVVWDGNESSAVPFLLGIFFRSVAERSQIFQRNFFAVAVLGVCHQVAVVGYCCHLIVVL